MIDLMMLNKLIKDQHITKINTNLFIVYHL